MGFAADLHPSLIRACPPALLRILEHRENIVNAHRAVSAVFAAVIGFMTSTFTSAATISITDSAEGMPSVTYSSFPPLGFGPAFDCQLSAENAICHHDFPPIFRSDFP